MPGAVLLNTLGAIRGGAGLVTTVTPGTLGLNLAGACPEAMWPSYPETHDGRLSPHGWSNLLVHLAKADAITAGSGTVPDTDSLMLYARLVAETKLPLVLDGGALHPSVINECKNRPADAGPVVITPHAGEFIRLSAQPDENPADYVLKDWAKARKIILVLKGPCTRITDGKRLIQNFRGSPALARGGTGDVLAGILGAALAEMHVRKPKSTPDDALEVVARSVYWHALAGEVLARHKGQSAARTLDLVDSLPEALEFDPEVAVVDGTGSDTQTRPPMMPGLTSPSSSSSPAASPAATGTVRPNPYNPYQSRQIGPPK
jgi:NAD(P)H-hydrate epimerase